MRGRDRETDREEEERKTKQRKHKERNMIEEKTKTQKSKPKERQHSNKREKYISMENRDQVSGTKIASHNCTVEASRTDRAQSCKSIFLLSKKI